MARNLIVNYVPMDVGDDDLRTLFQKCGELESARIIKDRVTGVSRGYAFVKYINAAGAAAAVDKLNGYEWSGKRLKIGIAQNDCRREPSPGLHPVDDADRAPPPSYSASLGLQPTQSVDGVIGTPPQQPLPPPMQAQTSPQSQPQILLAPSHPLRNGSLGNSLSLSSASSGGVVPQGISVMSNGISTSLSHSGLPSMQGSPQYVVLQNPHQQQPQQLLQSAPVLQQMSPSPQGGIQYMQFLAQPQQQPQLVMAVPQNQFPQQMQAYQMPPPQQGASAGGVQMAFAPQQQWQPAMVQQQPTLMQMGAARPTQQMPMEPGPTAPDAALLDASVLSWTVGSEAEADRGKVLP